MAYFLGTAVTSVGRNSRRSAVLPFGRIGSRQRWLSVAAAGGLDLGLQLLKEAFFAFQGVWHHDTWGLLLNMETKIVGNAPDHFRMGSNGQFNLRTRSIRGKPIGVGDSWNRRVPETLEIITLVEPAVLHETKDSKGLVTGEVAAGLLGFQMKLAAGKFYSGCLMKRKL